MTKLAGLTALITGASQGLGVAIARQFVIDGASVILTARTRSLLETVVRSLLPLRPFDTQIITAIPSDVSKTEEVDALVASAASATGQLDVLINNASVFGPMGRLMDVPWSGWVETVNVNFLGTVYVCRVAIPYLKRSPRGKIVNISGGGAAHPFPSLSAYAASKAAIVRFTEELAEEMRPYGIDVNSVAPGPLNTRFVDEALAAGPDRLGPALYKAIVDIRESGGTPFALGAKSVRLPRVAAKRRGDSKLISARYDDWGRLHERIDELDSTNIYTMRRIDPSTAKS